MCHMHDLEAEVKVKTTYLKSPLCSLNNYDFPGENFTEKADTFLS